MVLALICLIVIGGAAGPFTEARQASSSGLEFRTYDDARFAPLSVVFGPEETRVTVYSDGRISYSTGYSPDAASRAFWNKVRAVAMNSITITFTDAEWAAATKRVGICETTPSEDGKTATVNCVPTITAWAHKQLHDSLAPELTAMKIEKAEAVESDESRITALDAKSCDVINAALRAEGLAPLKRCGGDRVP